MANATTPVIQINEGQVGIGTTGPGSKLDIANTLGNTKLTIQAGNPSSVTGGSSIDIISRSSGSGTSPISRIEGIFEDSNDSAITLSTTEGGVLSEKMNIASDGSVVIGSSTLTGPRSLTLLSATNATEYDINFQQAGTTNFGRIRFTEGAADFQFFAQVGQDPNLTLQYGGDSFFSRGNVGINTTSPDFKLDVDGTFGVSDLPFNSSSVSVLVADETIGAETITNGDFATDSDWTKSSNVSISGGQATFTANSAAQYIIQGNLWPANSLSGQKVKLTYTIVSNSLNAGDFRIGGYTGASAFTLNGLVTTVGTHNIILDVRTTAGNDNAIDLYITSAATSGALVIDDVSVKEVTSASNQIQKSDLSNLSRTNPAASLYDLIPNGAFTTTYAFTSTAGTYAEVMSGNDVITATGTYSVQMLVNDFAVGGTQYDVKYSGVMTWHAGSVNDNGQGAESEIVLHRTGHASNSGITYLRTRETTNAANPGPNELKLEIMGNRTYTAASNVIFKFVRLI